MNDDTFRCDGCLREDLPGRELTWVTYARVWGEPTHYGIKPLKFCRRCVRDMTHKLEGHAATPVKPEPLGLVCPVCRHTVDVLTRFRDVGTCLRCALNNMC